MKPFFIENIGTIHSGKYFLIVSKVNNPLIYWGHYIKEEKKERNLAFGTRYNGYNNNKLNKIDIKSHLIIRFPTGNFGFYFNEMKKIKDKKLIKNLKKEFEKIQLKIIIETL